MTIYREGDKVRLVTPRRIVKVGYDNDPEAYEEEASNAPEVESLRDRLNLDEGAIDRIVRAICCGMMASRRRSGNKRKITFSNDPHPRYRRAVEFRVISKHVVYEGVYDSGGWFGDGEYETPTLLDRKATIVLELVPWSWNLFCPREPGEVTHYESGLFVTPDEVTHA